MEFFQFFSLDETESLDDFFHRQKVFLSRQDWIVRLVTDDRYFV